MNHVKYLSKAAITVSAFEKQIFTESTWRQTLQEDFKNVKLNRLKPLNKLVYEIFISFF